ncbi:MAG: L-threonylcarbamoyladenylate synthase [Chloroflexota bacterium]
MASPLMLPAERPENILAAARILREGGVVVVPTDTLYGVAASVFHDDAVRRVYRLKGRPAEQRVPVLLATAADITILTHEPSAVAWTIIGAFWPGGLTIVLPAAPSAPRIITQDAGSVAVRVPANFACLQLLQALGEPIVGTSANRSGHAAATTAQAAVQQLPGVDAVLCDDDGIRAGAPSTIVEVEGDVVRILRSGAVNAADIRRALGPMVRVEEQLPHETMQQ